MKNKASRLTAEILEMAENQHRFGVMDDATFKKITLRHIAQNEIPTAKPVTAEDIRKIREKARMSQAVFARHLNVTTGYVSQLERGTKLPTGAALALLNVIRRKGIDAVL